MWVAAYTDDAAARLDVVTLGSNILKLDYNYYSWTSQGGRLQQIKTGTVTDTTSLQDLRYVYDAVGNVLTIQDYKAGNPQTQTFTYDALDRLRMAVRTGTGNPNYLLGDHLGSTSITANSSGGFVSEVRYLPFGQDRYTSGTTPTTYRFTGQRQEAGLGGPGATDG